MRCARAVAPLPLDTESIGSKVFERRFRQINHGSDTFPPSMASQFTFVSLLFVFLPAVCKSLNLIIIITFLISSGGSRAADQALTLTVPVASAK